VSPIRLAERSWRKKELPEGYEVRAESFVADVGQGRIYGDAGNASAKLGDSDPAAGVWLRPKVFLE
jgi:hypothetical protein